MCVFGSKNVTVFPATCGCIRGKLGNTEIKLKITLRYYYFFLNFLFNSEKLYPHLVNDPFTLSKIFLVYREKKKKLYKTFYFTRMREEKKKNFRKTIEKNLFLRIKII